MCSDRVCAPRPCIRPPVARRRRAVLIARPVPLVGGRAHVVAFGSTGRVCRARLGAGVSWTSRTLAAPWAARQEHTSVVDADGAIYVIGGHFHDVWASTDGGVRPDSVEGWSMGYSRGY